ncbi:hypothetical protein OBP_097 [Pseudomonas phage OBP]|uniref:hypothetical protein n=1 Tax=Pseudomonas phage OBP TaxID=1124849 RepID=UPI000240D43F|nr:hypothetical protein OBP_097 [Pseudomonas phage OBP]AEV89534.1 hypothetical protein OBP_097 [Pseudomonas phage OBP]
MAKEITEEQFNHDIPPSILEKSFRELLNETFIKDKRAYLIHEVRNMSHHSGFENIFNYEYIDHYERVVVEKDAIVNPFFDDSPDRPEKLDALVIPFMDGYGSVCHIKLCISISEYEYPTYELRFQVRGVRRNIHLPVTPKNALPTIKKLQYPGKF